ncbi:hypothetical protein ACPV36_12845 [Photobacterium damselae]|uniref:hypothetical protein n=1 Tax=Photobacterium damselae TaxID=38293 RepID=UPI0040679FAC
MIKITLTIEDLKDGSTEIDASSISTGKPTGIEMAHARTIFSFLESSEYQGLVESSFIENDGACQREKCQAKRKQSEAPIRLVH